nr:MAG TPA: hypothetical protein [Caudoviricetes sp.]
MRSKNSGTITFFIDIFFMVYKNSNNAWNNQIYTNLLRGLMRMFSCHRLGLGLMNCAVRVLNGSINRIQFDWLITRIHQIMPFSGRHEHRIIRLYFLHKIEFILCITHQDTSFSLFDTKKLVNIGMQFQTYITADRNRHQRYLQICTRPQGGTEILITHGISFDVQDGRSIAVIFQNNLGSVFGSTFQRCVTGIRLSAGRCHQEGNRQQSHAEKVLVSIHNPIII